MEGNLSSNGAADAEQKGEIELLEADCPGRRFEWQIKGLAVFNWRALCVDTWMKWNELNW